MTGPAEFWAGLDEPWRLCLELAWEAFAEGSIPVGAVLTDGRDRVVAADRNRAAGNPGAGLGGSFVAHAELNVLSTLAPGEYADHTVVSSLEPCFMCSAAAAHSHVGTMRFAAADPLMSGIERVPELNAWMASRWPRRSGPQQEPLAAVAGLLYLVWNLRRTPDGVVKQAYRRSDPAALERASGMDRSGALDRCRSVTEAVEAMWPQLGID